MDDDLAYCTHKSKAQSHRSPAIGLLEDPSSCFASQLLGFQIRVCGSPVLRYAHICQPLMYKPATCQEAHHMDLQRPEGLNGLDTHLMSFVSTGVLCRVMQHSIH